MPNALANLVSKGGPLWQTAQAASNAVAQNVSGPVDMLGFALRKLGLPVPEDAVGSSQWMAQKGLTAEVPMGAPRIIGETAGMVSPIAAAAYAPQIAAWRNMVAERLAPGAPGKIPTSIPRGAIVYHGSPHKFDKFDSTKIGTGEGAQAYGHGLYLADSPGVAKSYQQKLATNEVTYKGQPYKPVRSATDPQSMGLNALSIEPGPLEAAAKLRAAAADDATWFGYGASDKALRPKYVEAADWLEKNAADITVNNGSLYKVDLPDSAIARMLDWDKPLSQQAPAVRDAVAKVMEKRAAAAEAERLAMNAQYPARTTHPVLGKIANKPRTAFDYKGEAAVTELVKELGGPDKAAAYFRAQGIPGIRYLDGGSRAAGTGTSNYVVFPGEENILKILARNGETLP